jgi:hypothetical protein
MAIANKPSQPFGAQILKEHAQMPIPVVFANFDAASGQYNSIVFPLTPYATGMVKRVREPF